MTIPIGAGELTPGAVGGASVPGFDIPTHDTVIITEDALGTTLSVEYQAGGSQVALLNFTYSDYVPEAPNKTTTISKV